MDNKQKYDCSPIFQNTPFRTITSPNNTEDVISCYRIEEKEETNIVYTTISESAEGADTGPLFQIFFTEEGGRIIYGGAVAGGSILCMLLVDK